MNVHPLFIDFLVAIIVAALLVIVISGVATLGLIAALALAACGVSLLIDRRRGRRLQRLRRRPR